MSKFPKTGVLILTTAFVVALSSIAHAGVYDAGAITSIAVGSGGEMYIRWDGLPNPGLCGDNNNWVMIPSSAPDTMKSLALSLYFSGKSAQIRTEGCSGAYELVVQLYSPKGG